MFPIGLNEAERLSALRALRVIGTEDEEQFDAVCRTASVLFGLPIVLVSLIEEDRQWFKGYCGLDVDGTGREGAFCNYTILSDAVLVVEDAVKDERFARNPLVIGAPHIRFYAGAPLSLNPGLRVGTLCIIDTKPRSFSVEQQLQLQTLAKIIVAHLRLQMARQLNETEAKARQQAELALLESERRYRALSEALPQMVWVMRPEDGRATYTNQPFRTYYGSAGVTRQERLDHNHPDDAERMERTWRTALAQGGTFEVEGRLRRHDGAYRWHKLMMLPIHQHDGVSGWIGTALDIHDSVEARHKLEETADFLRLAQEAAGAAIWDWNLQTGFVRYPLPSARMLGLVVPDGLGEDDTLEVSIEDWKALVYPQSLEAVRSKVEEAVTAGSTYASEFRLLSDRADGCERWLLGFGRVVFDPATGEATRIVGLNLDISERKRSEQRLAHLARHDTLTNLPNRALFREQFEQKLAEVRRDGKKLALFCLDLDRFKQVNDNLGHPAGDALLIEVAKRLKSAIRTEDTLARLGGDEFVIFQTGLNGLEDAVTLANRLIAAVGHPFWFEEHKILVGLSIGIALMPDHGLEQDVVFKCADAALYRAKAAGRNTFRAHELIESSAA
ncbi:hypothetical protein ASF60_19850 [Methylobacterium sp. Leaf113]|uniref:sensor domain-containing diguanylate cyclase n=1 Tax=Methylobacterium sp. Leaf113 TaxID=1736259 RepID=UPI0006FCB3D2|nr:diguanylate cyclase [Methylobacterium sp. Leaf113]KQP88999.1 hypothetical protein ASF60_19850 [Methylobacterium sp. Leaf113]